MGLALNRFSKNDGRNLKRRQPHRRMKSICTEIVRKALENKWDFTGSEGWKCSEWLKGKGVPHG